MVKKSFCTVTGFYLSNHRNYHILELLLFTHVDLTGDTSLDLPKLKAFADDKFLMLLKRFIFYREENIVGKGENAGYQHFLLFPQYFQKAFFFRGMTEVVTV